MIFDLHPKEKLEELAGREKDVEYMLSQLLYGNWVILSGQREIGKTSTMKVVINEMRRRRKIPGIYLNLRGITSLNSLLSHLLTEINRDKIEWNFHVNVNLVITSAGIEVRRGSKVVNSLVELLNSAEEIVIGLDEVQELYPVSRQFLEVLGNVFSSNPRVHFLFSGSYVGVVETLLNPPSNSPLHGRPPVEIRLKPFTREESRSFLERGMKEAGVNFDRFEVIDVLDGVVGWLTLFGNFFALRRLDYYTSLRGTLEEAKKIMRDEFNHFLSRKGNRKLYCEIMNVLKVVSRWKEIKRGVEIALGRIDDKEFSSALQNLVKYNFVVKSSEEYRIEDPVLREVEFRC
ncbi:AAA family ATPase [Metallosphaera javensis (ex Sakai et al. 2022)]|uniref:AAA family ATPase n=1 Tax=Metallosphaera javensis (ex Sakai et al. 2022) TaxID=2775498 RepID=UPI00258FB346|nr:MAG: hypothetical protein MjAS7_2929 [Metallosphaera javensis (ex Sakai et al. 2022)]